MRDLWDEHTVTAQQVVLDTMLKADDPELRFRAAVHWLDRGLGKPVTALDVVARRGPDAGVTVGQPDAARAKIEALIAAASQATVIETVAKSDANPDNLLSLPAVSDDGGEPGAESRPESQSHSVPPHQEETA